MTKMCRRREDHVNWPIAHCPNALYAYFQTCICVLCWFAPWACCPFSCLLWFLRVSTFTDGTEKKVQRLVCPPHHLSVILSLQGQRSTLQFQLPFLFVSFFSLRQPAICWSSVQKAGTIYTALQMENNKIFLYYYPQTDGLLVYWNFYQHP